MPELAQQPQSTPPNGVALVTGASRGIGRAIAIELARLGYRIAINFARSESAAQTAVDEITSFGGTAIAIKADISVSRDRAELVNTVLRSFGRIDVLVNNAAVPMPTRIDLLEVDEEAWNHVLNTNLQATFFLTQAVAREMIRLRRTDQISRGTIVNVSSISAYTVSLDRGPYCVAKAGLEMLTKLFAARLAPEQIRVYQVRPGIIRTDMTAPVKEKYDHLFREGLCPISRWGEPEDVARVVATLVTADWAYSTGDTINVDGGFHIRSL